MTLEQAQYVRDALKAVERYGNIFRYGRHQVSPYEKVVAALQIMDTAIADELNLQKIGGLHEPAR